MQHGPLTFTTNLLCLTSTILGTWVHFDLNVNHSFGDQRHENPLNTRCRHTMQICNPYENSSWNWTPINVRIPLQRNKQAKWFSSNTNGLSYYFNQKELYTMLIYIHISSKQFATSNIHFPLKWKPEVTGRSVYASRTLLHNPIPRLESLCLQIIATIV